ncbi:hypothetical protein CORC01_11628 [Colletotrichum orchidophilum]|uniref:Nephrocystin 3-like N-terminal domain-containing protein n=1 Tax=Colletotrichum orchidophilum TaxID=1209926 RepID=A0A1G4AVD2_9PEZI|nr:uncharacterized protein CORC01_11628 [Colletotrichum orchidophilum]OHE93071.1 hypothetical protein CORC01_11628 [Colletotrichum orchidophilum]
MSLLQIYPDLGGSPDLRIASPIVEKVDIIIVPGLKPSRKPVTGSGYRDDLTQAFIDGLLPIDFPNSRVLFFDFDPQSAFRSGFTENGLATVTLHLLQHAIKLRRKDPLRPIIFIAHGLGGILVKSALLRAALDSRFKTIRRATKGIAFFGTPHRAKSPDATLETLVSDFASQLRVPVFLRAIVISSDSATLGLPEEQESIIALPSSQHDFWAFTSSSDPNYCIFRNKLAWLLGWIAQSDPVRYSLEFQDLKWLRHLLPPGLKSREHLIQEPVEGTCKWIWSHPSFDSWLHADKSTTLWLTGKPGSGKSTLLRYVSDYLCDFSDETPYEPLAVARRSFAVANFFCDFSAPPKSSEIILRSLLHQVLTVQPSLLRYLTPVVKRRRQWSTGTEFSLVTALREISKHRGIVCVIDALDECDDGVRTSLLDSLADHLVSPSEESWKSPCALGGSCPCRTSSPQLKIILSSRPNLSIRNHENPNAQHLSLSTGVAASSLAKDFQAVIKSSFPLLGFNDERLEALLPIARHLIRVENAAGVFLWTKLALKSLQFLETRTSENLLNSLANLPTNLNDMYSSILSSINKKKSEEKSYILKCLDWVIFARRPLRVEELAAAIAFETKNSYQHGSPTSIYPHSFLDLGYKFSRRSATIRFSQVPLIEIKGSTQHNGTTMTKLQVNLKKGIVLSFLGKETEIANLLRRNYMKADECTPKGEEWTPLMAASWSGHESVVQLLLQQHIDYATHPDHSSRALTHAIERGHTLIAQEITMAFAQPTAGTSLSLQVLSHGADSPLATAARHGHSEIVSLLLNTGVSVNSHWSLPDRESKLRNLGSVHYEWLGEITPLALAVSQNDMDMIEVLNASGVSFKDYDYLSLAASTAKRGEDEIARHLVSLGCPVNERNQLGETAADIVALQGNAAWLQQLLDSGSYPSNFTWRNALKSGSIDTLLVLIKACREEIELSPKPVEVYHHYLICGDVPLCYSQAVAYLRSKRIMDHRSIQIEVDRNPTLVDSDNNTVMNHPNRESNSPLRGPASGTSGRGQDQPRGLGSTPSNSRRRPIPERQRNVTGSRTPRSLLTDGLEEKIPDKKRPNPDESDSDSKVKGRFVVIKPGSFPHDHVEVRATTTDSSFFDDLQMKYCIRRSKFKTYFSIHRFHHWGFDRYEHFRGNYCSIADGCAKSTLLPEAPLDQDYDFKRLANDMPPISQPIFYSHCYDCKPDCSRIRMLHSCTNPTAGKLDEECAPEYSMRVAELLSRVPKRFLEWQPRNLDHEVAYGLSSFELPNVWGFVMYSILCFILPAALFWIFWLSIMGHEADLQNASVPATLGAVFWVILYQSTAGKRWCQKMQY